MGKLHSSTIYQLLEALFSPLLGELEGAVLFSFPYTIQ